MTFIYDRTARVKLICDVCTKQTDFYDTLDELLAAVHFGEPINTDAGATSWVYGPGAKYIGPGFTPLNRIDTRTHACPSCKSHFEALVFTEQPKILTRGAKIGQIGEPVKTVTQEDMEMNKTNLFKGTVSKYPRIFPRQGPGGYPEGNEGGTEG